MYIFLVLWLIAFGEYVSSQLIKEPVVEEFESELAVIASEEAGLELSNQEILVAEAVELYKNGKFKQALEKAKETITLKNEKGAFIAGMSALNLDQVEEGFNLILKSAEWGHPQGAYTVYLLYKQRRIMELNYMEEAYKWLDIAVERGHLEAIFQKANLLQNKDPVMSYELLKKASGLGHVVATNNLFMYYYQGHGVKKDLSNAFKYLKKACDMGYGVSCYNVSHMYIRGEFVEKSLDEAIKYAEKAYEAGSFRAMSLIEFLKKEREKLSE